MFTPMLSAPGSRCAGLEGMQKWVRLTQLELRKLIRVPALHKHCGLPGPPLPLAAHLAQGETGTRLQCAVLYKQTSDR